jgi:hypothetical protein
MQSVSGDKFLGKKVPHPHQLWHDHVMHSVADITALPHLWRSLSHHAGAMFGQKYASRT